MLALLLSVQKVELLGGETWLEHNSVAIAAILAAALAAGVSVVNRKAQLKHDRELRNRDYVRDAIDTSAGAMNDAIITVHKYVTLCERRPPVVTDLSGELSAAHKAARHDLFRVRTAVVPLELRLGKKHEIVKRYRNGREALLKFFNDAHSVNADSPQGTLDTQRKAVGKAYDPFRQACFAWLNEGERADLRRRWRGRFGRLSQPDRRKDRAAS
ncbi:MAG TPA: hypothetical protein VFN18_11510 [Solirubrobacterales bacterium]|nr:hypothetical protein [Solirubrobacterales bacterium]